MKEPSEKIDPQKITSREATKNDIGLIYNWRNDPAVRKNMFNPDEIKWDEHVRFWDKRLCDNNAFSMILGYGNSPVGFIRLDKEKEGYEVGIIIDPKFQGKGFGTIAIEVAVSFAKSKGIKRLFSRIKPDNSGSRKIFERNGFRLDHYSYALILDA